MTLQTITLIQGIVMTVGMVIVGLLMKSFNAGSKFRDFERANKLISELAGDVNSLPEKCRREMQQELDRYNDYVLTPQLTAIQRELDRIGSIIDRRRDGDRRQEDP